MKTSVLNRNNVRLAGAPNGRPLVLVHGFGCDQTVWHHTLPAFEDDHMVVLFDHVGAGGSDLAAYDRERYATLHAYAEDLIDIVEELELEDVAVAGHSAGATIAALAAAERPDLFAHLVLLTPSPRFIDDPATGYVGGFSEADIAGLLDAIERNFLGWVEAMAPVIMGNPERPELGADLSNRFCRTDPEIAADFARVVFGADHRADLSDVTRPTLIVQCSTDPLAPAGVGDHVHRAIAGSELVTLEANGHCPHLSAPAETGREIARWLRR